MLKIQVVDKDDKELDDAGLVQVLNQYGGGMTLKQLEEMEDDDDDDDDDDSESDGDEEQAKDLVGGSGSYWGGRRRRRRRGGNIGGRRRKGSRRRRGGSAMIGGNKKWGRYVKDHVMHAINKTKSFTAAIRYMRNKYKKLLAKA
jgi:hypothetical protein